MPVDVWSPATLSVVVTCTASIPDHSARSRDVYLSADTSFTVRSPSFSLRRAGFRLAGKPLDPLNDTHRAPRHYRMEVRTKFSAASGKLAS